MFLCLFSLPVTHYIFGNWEDLSDHNYTRCPNIFRFIPHIHTLYNQCGIVALDIVSRHKKYFTIKNENVYISIQNK